MILAEGFWAEIMKVLLPCGLLCSRRNLLHDTTQSWQPMAMRRQRCQPASHAGMNF